jgi:hypothetical protein
VHGGLLMCRGLVRTFAAAVAIAILLPRPTHAEIERVAAPSPGGISLAWWPKVNPPRGWRHEREHSLAHGINALSREGSSFSEAESVMYAKAVYKPRAPLLKSVDDLIAKDKKEFLAREPSLSIREGDPLTSEEGKVFRVLSFTPRGKGNWERVAYGEEGEFYLVFVLSSRNQRGYKASSDDFERLVREYKEKP